MTVIRFPSTRPATLSQLEIPRAQLCGLLTRLANEALQQAEELMKAASAAEFAAVVHETANKVSEASAGWASVSETIRESWRASETS